MKNKLIYLVGISFLSISIFASNAEAYGTFELIDFPDTLNAVAGKAFTKHIDFFYSGGYTSSPRISVVSKNFPIGMSMSSAIAGGGNLYNATYSGNPTTPGIYNLILTLTDYDGAQLNKNFVFNVAGLTISEQLLPNAVINTPYEHEITYKYDGDKDPSFIVSDLPDYVHVNATMTYGNYGTFKLGLTSWKAGSFTFKVTAYVNGPIGEKVFTMTVNEKQQVKVPVTTSATVDTNGLIPSNPVTITPTPPTPALPKSTTKTVPKILEAEVTKKIPAILKEELIVSNDASSSTNDSSNIEVSPIIDKPTVPQRTWYYWLNPFNWFR